MMDWHEKLQPPRPKVDEKLIGVETEILFLYDEPDGTTSNMWCQGTVVAVKKTVMLHRVSLFSFTS